MNPKPKSSILHISVKVVDQFYGTILSGDHVVGSRLYYPPKLMYKDNPDYIQIRIDTATGKIKGWRKPTAKDLGWFNEHPENPDRRRSSATTMKVYAESHFLCADLLVGGKFVGSTNDPIKELFSGTRSKFYIAMHIDLATGKIMNFDGLSAETMARLGIAGQK